MLYIQYLIWFSQLLLNIYATIVPHFSEQETEARRGEVTSPGWAKIPARSEQPWDHDPAFPVEVFWTTPLALIADLQFHDNLPFTKSLSLQPTEVFFHLDFWFPPHSPHVASELLGGESTILFLFLLQSLPGHYRQSIPTPCTLTHSLGQVTWLREGQLFRAAPSLQHCGLFFSWAFPPLAWGLGLPSFQINIPLLCCLHSST